MTLRKYSGMSQLPTIQEDKLLYFNKKYRKDHTFLKHNTSKYEALGRENINRHITQKYKYINISTLDTITGDIILTIDVNDDVQQPMNGTTINSIIYYLGELYLRENNGYIIQFIYHKNNTILSKKLRFDALLFSNSFHCFKYNAEYNCIDYYWKNNQYQHIIINLHICRTSLGTQSVELILKKTDPKTNKLEEFRVLEAIKKMMDDFYKPSLTTKSLCKKRHPILTNKKEKKLILKILNKIFKFVYDKKYKTKEFMPTLKYEIAVIYLSLLASIDESYHYFTSFCHDYALCSLIKMINDIKMYTDYSVLKFLLIHSI